MCLGCGDQEVWVAVVDGGTFGLGCVMEATEVAEPVHGEGRMALDRSMFVKGCVWQAEEFHASEREKEEKVGRAKY